MLTVRRLILGWQIVEFAIFVLLFRHSDYSFIGIIFVALLAMITLRAFVVAVVTISITLSNRSNHLTLAKFLGYWWGEFFAFCLLYFWYQAKPRADLIAKTDEYLSQVHNDHVIFAHGFFCNDGFWFQLAPKILTKGYSVSGVEMAGVFTSVDHFSELLAQEIERCYIVNPAANISIVAFSMGGLACRNLPATLQAKVNVITLYTPYQGTRFANMVGWFGAANCQEMSVKSAWLTSVSKTPLAYKKAVGIWSTHDTIVIPARLGKPPCHRLKLIGKGHLNAAIDAGLHRHVLRLLQHF